MEDMEKQIAAFLNDILLVQIQRYYFCTFFMFFLGFDRNWLYKDLPTVQHTSWMPTAKVLTACKLSGQTENTMVTGYCPTIRV
jgi:hypothetical protein